MSAHLPSSAPPLSAEQIARFHEHGFVSVPQAFDPEIALGLQDLIWDELREDHGILREDRNTWRSLPHSPRRAKKHPLAHTAATPRFQSIISQLLGREDWERPASWGGFVVPFPAEAAAFDVVRSIWHWDGSPTGEGLLIFSFCSSVAPSGGGTQVVRGSHRLIARHYAALSEEDRARPHRWQRRAFAHSHPWIEDLNGLAADPAEDRVAAFMERDTEIDGVDCRVVELTGEPGDAVFCNLGLYHAVAPNLSEHPRFVRVKFLFLGELSSVGSRR